MTVNFNVYGPNEYISYRDKSWAKRSDFPRLSAHWVGGVVEFAEMENDGQHRGRLILREEGEVRG